MSSGRIVYTTGVGRICPDCRRPVADCTCRGARGAGASAAASLHAVGAGGGVAEIRRETQGRRGKTVTTVSGLPLAPDRLDALASELKQACGAGGSVKDGVLEIQGDHRERIDRELRARGFATKFAGG